VAYKPVYGNRGGDLGQSQSDYLTDADPSTLLRDPRFQQEYREMRKRQFDGTGADDWTEDQLIEDFYTHQTWVNNNTVAGSIEFGRGKFADAAQKERMARIQRAYELAPTRGITNVDAWQDWAGATLLDPLNAFGVGIGARGAFAAARAGKGALGVAVQGAKSGAVAGAIENAVTEGTIDAINQGRMSDVGLQDGYDVGRGAVAAGVGGLFGVGIGGALGGAVAGASARGMTDVVARLRAAGANEEELAKMDYAQAREFARLFSESGSQEQSPINALPSEPGAQPSATPEPEAPEDLYDPEMLADAQRRAQDELDRMHREGAPKKEIRAAERNVATMMQLQKINELRRSYEQNTSSLIESDDAATRAKADQNLARIVRLESLARRLREDPSIAELKQITAEGEEIAAELEVTPAKAEGEGEVEPTEATGPTPLPTEPRGPVEFVQSPKAKPPEVPAVPGAKPYFPPGEDLAARLFEMDEELEEVFDILDDSLEPMRGHALFRETFTKIAQEKFPDQAEAVTKLYDERYGNPNGLPPDAFAKVVAAEEAPATPKRAQKRRAAKAKGTTKTKGATKAKTKTAASDPLDMSDAIADVTSKMAGPRKSMSEQLTPFLGNLVKRDAQIRGASEAFAERTAAKATTREADQSAAKAAADAARKEGRKRSATGRAMDELGQGYSTSGVGGNGRPQAILRAGQVTERDADGRATRTITDGSAPRRGALSQEAFELEALRNSKSRTVRQFDENGKESGSYQTEAQPVAEWTATEPMTGVIGGSSRTYETKAGKTKRQKGYVPKGTPLFYSPHTGKYYTNREYALAASGRGSKQKLSLKTLEERGLTREEEAPTPEAETPGAPPRADDLASWAEALRNGELSGDEFLALVQGASKREAKSSPDPKAQARAEVVTPKVAGDRVVAVRSRTNPDDVRVLSQRQADAGFGAEVLIGKGDPDDFIVGSVPAGTSSKTKAARDGFAESSADEINEAADADADPLENAPMSKTEAKATLIDLSRLTGPEFEELQLAYEFLRTKGAYKGTRLARDSRVTLADIKLAAQHLETFPWLKNTEYLDKLTRSLETLYALQTRYAPEGIASETATLAEANKAIDDIFAGRSPKEVAAAKSFLERLNGTQKPVIERGAVDMNVTGSASKITLKNDPENKFAPRLFALYHEVAHWAYENILTPAERLEFWGGIRDRFYADGTLDVNARDLGSVPVEAVGNATLSPQEYFANQFVAFMMRSRDKLVWDDVPFWTKMWNYMKAVFDRFASRDFIDESLEPLFAKIIPDPEDAAKFQMVKPRGELKTPQGRFIVSHINTINLMHDDLARALNSEQVETAIATARDIAEFLFKLTAIRNTFAPMRGRKWLEAQQGDMAKLVRDAAYKIADTLHIKPDEDFLVKWGDEFDPEAQDGPDAADIWLRGNDPEAGTVTTDPTVVFDALRKIWDDGTDTSIDTTVAYTSYTLNRALQVAEGRGAAFSATELPNAYRVSKEMRNTPKTEVRARNKEKRAEAAKEKTKKTAVETAKTPSSKRQPRESQTASTKQRSLRDMSLEELIAHFKKGGDLDRDASATEILRRQKVEPDAVWSTAKFSVPIEVRNAGAADLHAMMQDAIDDGDWPLVEQIMYEAYRRGENTRRKKSGQPPIRPRVSRLVSAAVNTEVKQHMGDVGDGIMQGAPTVVREIQSFMSHRDPEVQATMRTLVYRALNLMGKTTTDALNNTHVTSTADIYRLANRQQPAGATGVFADFRGEGFSALRSSLRKMAIGLTNDVSDPFDVMHEVYHLALRTGIFNQDDLRVVRDQFIEAAKGGDPVAKKRIELYAPANKSVDDLEDATIDTLAEEWFAESGALYSMGKVAKGDMFAIREGRDMRELSARSSLVAFANRMVEAVAYMVNGLIGRKTIKQMFRRIDGYGDMFATTRRVVDADPRTGGIAPEYAASYYADLMASMSGQRIQRMLDFVENGVGRDEDGVVVYYHGTPSGDALSSPDAVMRSGRSDFARGIHLTKNQMVADKVYAQNSTYDAMLTRAEGLRDEGKIAPEDFDEVADTVASIADIRREIGVLTRKRAMPDANTEKLDGDIDGLRRFERMFLAELEDMGLTNAPKVLGVVVRAKNPLDLRQGVTIQRDSALVARLLEDLEANGHIDYRDAAKWQPSLPSHMDAVEFHGLLTKLVLGDRSAGAYQYATDILADSFGRLGYDSVRATFPNTVPGGKQVFHEGLILLDHIDPSSGKQVSASNNVKSIEATAFDNADPILYHSLVSEVAAPNNAIMAKALNNETLGPSDLADVVNYMDSVAAPTDFTQMLLSAARQRRMDAGKTFSTAKKFFTAAFSANSKRMDEAGLKTVATWHRQHYVDHATELGDRVFKLRDMLDKLPDSPGSFGRWLNNIKPGKQPDSHSRILTALRMGGIPSIEFSRLSQAEKDVVIHIQDLLGGELSQLRKAGVIVGRIENYFPQIWDVESLQRDKDEFIDELGNYFMAEGSSEGRPIDKAEASKRAQGVWSRLVDDEGQYLPPPVGSSRTADSDHLRYQRLIHLENPEFEANAKALNKFLLNDLEGTLIKYLDGSVRSTLQGRRWGTMNHGYYDYLKVMDQGLDGIADLLSTNRVSRRDIRAIAEDGYLSTLEFRDETVMPFQGDDFGARQAARRVHEIFNTSGAAAAKDFLMALDPARTKKTPVGYEAPTKSTYEHRVDAIVDGLRDGGGLRGAAEVEEIMFAESAMQAALRKQVGHGPLHTKSMRDASRGIRTFNAVTLLSFTTLTSMTDLVLPVIRSGKASAQIKAMAKMASDPDYARGIRNTGVAIESIVHQRMAGLFATDISGKLGKANNAFFNATLLTPWTDMVRQIAGATGFEAFSVDVSKAIRAKVGDGLDMSQQTPEYRRIMRRLNHYGIGHLVHEGRAMGKADMEDPLVKNAIVQFANESIFAPNPDDMPLWTQTPWGSIIWQLKSYPVMLGRMSADIIGKNGQDVRRAWKSKDLSELDPDNMKSLLYLFTLGPAAGAATLAAKDIVQFRGGEDQREAQLRVRNWQKFLGYNERIHGNENDFAGWFAEGMMALGGLGLLADILHTTVEGAENGAFGQTRVLSALAGPTVGTVGSGVTVLGGVTDKTDTNGKERAAWREAIRRVPFVGGMGGVREGLVDSIAGEKGLRDDGTPQKGGSSGFGSGGFGGDGFGGDGFGSGGF